MSIPLKEGKPMTDQELDNLSQEEIEELMKTSGELNQKAFDYVKRVKNIENDLIKEIKSLKEKNVLQVLNNYIDILIEKYDGNDEIHEYLNDMKADIVKNYDMFMKEDEKSYLEGIF